MPAVPMCTEDVGPDNMKTYRVLHLFLHPTGSWAMLARQVKLNLADAAESADRRPGSIIGTAIASVNRFLVPLCNGERTFALRQPLNSLPAAPSCGHVMNCLPTAFLFDSCYDWGALAIDEPAADGATCIGSRFWRTIRRLEQGPTVFRKNRQKGLAAKQGKEAKRLLTQSVGHWGHW